MSHSPFAALLGTLYELHNNHSKTGWPLQGAAKGMSTVSDTP